MPLLARFLRLVNVVPVALACAALFIMMVMTFCDVILRSTFDAPIQAATEMTRILMAITVFSVMPMISARGGHIVVDLADPVFDRLRLTRLRNGLVQILAGAMLYWPVTQMWRLALRAHDRGDVTEYLGIPQYLTAGFITIFTGLAAVAFVVSGLLALLAPRTLKALS